MFSRLHYGNAALGVPTAPFAVCVERCGQVNLRSSTLGAYQHIVLHAAFTGSGRSSVRNSSWRHLCTAACTTQLPATCPLFFAKWRMFQLAVAYTVIFMRRHIISPPDTACHHGSSNRAFPVAAAKLWNELPGNITAAQSLTAFRCQLKVFLFRHSYPDFV
jgi:hypothetical protein